MLFKTAQNGKIKGTGDLFPNTTELVYLKMVMMGILCIFYHNLKKHPSVVPYQINYIRWSEARTSILFTRSMDCFMVQSDLQVTDLISNPESNLSTHYSSLVGYCKGQALTVSHRAVWSQKFIEHFIQSWAGMQTLCGLPNQ